MKTILHVYTFFLTFLSSVVFATPQRRASASEIEGFISDLTTLATTASDLLTNYGGTLTQALTIHTALGNLSQTFSDDTTQLVSGPITPQLSEEDGTIIVNQANNDLTPKINTIFEEISNFDDSGLPIGGVGALIKSDGQTLQSSSTAFYNALAALLPADAGTLHFPGPPIVIGPGN